jgi:hypothetical protein
MRRTLAITWPAKGLGRRETHVSQQVIPRKIAKAPRGNHKSWQPPRHEHILSGFWEIAESQSFDSLKIAGKTRAATDGFVSDEPTLLLIDRGASPLR